MVQQLFLAIRSRGADSLAPELRDDFVTAPDDGQRIRVVADQVASLTDASAVAWHRRLC
jgi:dGTPase